MDEYNKDDLGLGSKYNVNIPDDGTLTFFNLGKVHIDYVEMKRQSEQIVNKGRQGVTQLKNLAQAIQSLAALVGCSIDTSGFDAIISEIENDYNYISEEINSQIDLYVKQTNLTSDELVQLNKLVSEVISSNGKIKYYDRLDPNMQTISYNELLNDYHKAELMSGYGVADLEILLEICKAGNKSVDDIYAYIEEKLGVEMKEAEEAARKAYIEECLRNGFENPEKLEQEASEKIKITTGEEYLNYLLEHASAGALTNREKAVKEALALCLFLGDNEISGKYRLGGGHTGDSQYTLTSALSSGVDCSAFASTLARLGNPNFNAGATGTLIQGTTSIDVNNILPGDIIVSTYSGYEHARFVLGVDTVNNRLITVEAGGYSDSGGYDTNYDYFDNIHVDSFDIDTLIRQGYKANHVDYDSSGQTTL